MVLVAVPTLRAQWTGVDAGILPASHSARVVDDRLAADYPQLSADPVVVAVHAPAGARAAVERYAASIARVDGVRAVSAPARLDGSTWRIDAVVPGSPLAGRAQDAVKEIRALPRPFRGRRRRRRGALRRRPRRDHRRPAGRAGPPRHDHARPAVGR